MDHKKIYDEENKLYELLVSHEDKDGNILKTLNNITTFSDCDLIELGAGTGRLTEMVAPICRNIKAFDLSEHMLEITAQKLTRLGLENWIVAEGEHTKIDSANNSTDIVLAGWTISYLTKDDPEFKMKEVELALEEMKRVLREDGVMIIIETLGTGFKEPKPPLKRLERMYSYLEDDHGFSRKEIRTDYLFSNLADAQRAVGNFFDDEVLAKLEVVEEGYLLPECTGIWYKKLKS